MDAAINEADLFGDDDVSADEIALLHEAGDKFLRPENVEDEEDARLDAEAEADIAAGRVVPHAKVRDWLLSIGTPNELPVPQSWRK